MNGTIIRFFHIRLSPMYIEFEVRECDGEHKLIRGVRHCDSTEMVRHFMKYGRGRGKYDRWSGKLYLAGIEKALNEMLDRLR